MNINIEALKAELLKSGTDERVTRALMIFARHVNESLEKHAYRLDEHERWDRAHG